MATLYSVAEPLANELALPPASLLLLKHFNPKVSALGLKCFVFARLALLVIGGVVGTPLPHIGGIVQSSDETLDGLGVGGNFGVVAVAAFQRVTKMLDEFFEGSCSRTCNISPRLGDGVSLGLASGGFVSGDTHGVLLCFGDFNNLSIVSISTAVNNRNQ